MDTETKRPFHRSRNYYWEQRALIEASRRVRALNACLRVLGQRDGLTLQFRFRQRPYSPDPYRRYHAIILPNKKPL